MKSLLDVADNLERAAGSVTDESLQGLASDGKPLTAEQCNKLLNGLLEGVHLTDRILVQASAAYYDGLQTHVRSTGRVKHFAH